MAQRSAARPRVVKGFGLGRARHLLQTNTRRHKLAAPLIDEDTRQAILALPTQARQLARAGEIVDKVIADGRFTYTGWLALGEPWRTWGFMHLDGIDVVNSIAQYHAREPRVMPAVLCVGVNGHNVRPIVHVKRPLPGSDQFATEKGRLDLGPWALVGDEPRDRMARALIFRASWGVRKDSTFSEIVEWRWLDMAVKSGEATIHNAAELHAEILAKYASDPTFCVAASLPLPTTEKKPTTTKEVRVER